MEKIQTNPDAACVQVFGKISASLSHDLKNVLAIINESAGLLDDLALRAAKGHELPLDRLTVTTGRILKQVQRGDAFLKNMNRFAHTTDTPVLQGNVAETISLMIDLAARQAAMKEITLTTAAAAEMITTFLIYFEAFIYLLLRHIIETLPARETVDISVKSEQGMICIRLENTRGLALTHEKVFPGEEEKALMAQIKAEMTITPGALILRVPATLE